MKMLYILQQSILSPNKKWLVADSNINMMTGFLNAFLTTETGFTSTVDVVIAPLEDFDDIKSFNQITYDGRIRFIERKTPTNAIVARQEFNVDFWQRVLVDGKYDVIINCVTEISRNIKTLLFVNKLSAKLVTQCFWLDTPEIGEPKVDESISYQWRQFDGFECSDIVVFTCQSTLDAWYNNAVEVFSFDKVIDIMTKTVVWDFGYSDTEMQMGERERERYGNWPVIAFLNRYTSDDYTNFNVFVEALKLVKSDPAYADKFVVWYTNPSQRLTEEWLIENVPNYEVYPYAPMPLARQDYINFLCNADITVHLFVKERYGGCALRESVAAGNTIVGANCHEQRHFISSPLMAVEVHDGKLVPSEVAEAIKMAIDFELELLDQEEIDGIEKSKSSAFLYNYTNCSFEVVARQVERDLKDFLILEEAQ